jgi:RNA polymerase sigma factor (sigma-70 family)
MDRADKAGWRDLLVEYYGKDTEKVLDSVSEIAHGNPDEECYLLAALYHKWRSGGQVPGYASWFRRTRVFLRSKQARREIAQRKMRTAYARRQSRGTQPRESDSDDSEGSMHLRTALGALSERLRWAIDLRFRRGLSMREVAREMNLSSAGAADRTIRDAVEALRRELSDQRGTRAA